MKAFTLFYNLIIIILFKYFIRIFLKKIYVMLHFSNKLKNKNYYIYTDFNIILII